MKNFDAICKGVLIIVVILGMAGSGFCNGLQWPCESKCGNPNEFGGNNFDSIFKCAKKGAGKRACEQGCLFAGQSGIGTCKQIYLKCLSKCNGLPAGGQSNFASIFNCQRIDALVEGCRSGCAMAEDVCNKR